MSWRDDPITDKQKSLIEWMEDQQFFPLKDVFTGTTKGEAHDFIDEYLDLAIRGHYLWKKLCDKHNINTGIT